ncbi:protein ROS1C-like isoform X2 [Rhododendron vialii]|uniref:protein ROS1C-like isoform X2 n=1 Tax=Rhododendron vialii TaxID=182163 RepID=UPI00265DFC88|nr:protein ROS1C-like isoform X2 [Rhododendron vialii]
MRVECEHFKSESARNTLTGLQEKRTSCSNSLITSVESKVDCEQTCERDNEDLVVDTSKAIGKTQKAASVSALGKRRTEHVVYELLNSHPVLQDSKEPDCTYPYLLAIWTTGATSNRSMILIPPKKSFIIH